MIGNLASRRILRFGSRPLIAGLCFAGVMAGVSVALASGGVTGGKTSSTPSSGNTTGHSAPQWTTGTAPDLTTCDKGMVWDRKNQKCVVKRSGILPDFDLTEYAYSLAKADRYQEALDVLDMLKDPNTARALNYRGYATRKLGHTEEGIGYYLKSVALDPTYAQVREYLGEAYVTLGKFDLANEQLATIQNLCGTTQCEEYEDLATAIKQAKPL